MRPYLAIEGISKSADIYVTRFQIHKSFQDLFRCHIRITWFDRQRCDADKLPGKSFSIRWISDKPQKTLFSGVVDQIVLFQHDDHTEIEIFGFTPLHYSLNLQKRFHAFQKKDQTVLDILGQVKGFRYKIYGESFNNLLSQPYPLGLQAGETDFYFISNLLALFGVPILLNEEDDEFIIGYQNKSRDEPVDYHTVGYHPETDPFFNILHRSHSFIPEHAYLPAGDGYPNWGQRKNSDVFQRTAPIIEAMQRQAGEASLTFTTHNHLFYPGDIIRYPLQQHFTRRGRADVSDYLRVASVQYDYGDSQDDLSVTVTCLTNPDSLCAPLSPASSPPMKLLGKVLKTNGDPLKMGRIMAGLFFDQKDFDKAKVACWLPVITPYQGEFEGFCFIPEKGNKVIVECLDMLQGQWAVTGTLRTQKQPINIAKPEQIKILRTSFGNQIEFESKPSASKPAREIIRIQNGINTIEVDSKSKSGQITLSQNGKSVFRVSLKGMRKQNVEITSMGNLVLKAKGNIQIHAGKKLDIKAGKSGKIKVANNLTLQGDDIYLN